MCCTGWKSSPSGAWHLHPCESVLSMSPLARSVFMSVSLFFSHFHCHVLSFSPPRPISISFCVSQPASSVTSLPSSFICSLSSLTSFPCITYVICTYTAYSDLFFQFYLLPPARFFSSLSANCVLHIRVVVYEMILSG